MSYLEFISDSDLVTIVGRVVNIINESESEADKNLYKNVLDPFSAVFHGITHGLSYTEWLNQEKVRQIQKTMQNAIGDFHQDILGAISGWTNFGRGGGLDVMNKTKMIIAEVKNKFNTTKGNHRVEIYDALKMKLREPAYKNFRGYYVEVVPKNQEKYNNPFAPSDNKTKKRRPVDQNIRVIDGVSFYALATGRVHALEELFVALPKVLVDVYGYKFNKGEALLYFELFNMAYINK